MQKRGSRDNRAEVDSTQFFFNMMDFVLSRMSPLFGEEGFEVFDANQDMVRRIKLKIIVTIEDGKGCPRVVGCKSDNAYYGACPFCKIVGRRYGTHQYYPMLVSNNNNLCRIIHIQHILDKSTLIFLIGPSFRSGNTRVCPSRIAII